MSNKNVIEFLRTVAAREDVLNNLKVRSKEEVIQAAADFGLPFSESAFDALIWNLEIQLAGKRKETFDARFPLWETMWGQYYLEYLVFDVIPGLEEAELYVPELSGS